MCAGCLSGAVQALAGVQAGATALLQRSHKARVARWLAWALAFALAGALLAGFSRDHGLIPINKSLWSVHQLVPLIIIIVLNIV